MPLDEAISVFPQHAGTGEVEQQLPAENEPASLFEVLLHALGIHEQPIDQIVALKSR